MPTKKLRVNSALYKGKAPKKSQPSAHARKEMSEKKGAEEKEMKGKY